MSEPQPWEQPPPPPASPPVPPRRKRPRLKLLLLVILPVLLVGGLVTAAVVWAPERHVDGSPAAAHGLVIPTTTTPTPEPVIEEDKVIVAKDRKSQITVPGDWVKGKPKKPVQIEASEEYGYSHALVVVFNKQDFDGFDGFRNFIRSTVEEQSKKFRMRYQQHDRIGGLPTVRLHYSATFDGMNYVYWDASVNGTNAFFHVTAGTTASEAKSIGKRLKEVVSSFRERSLD